MPERTLKSSCEIEYAAAWSDQGRPCGKVAVARCSDCGTAICSDCQVECCGDSYCGLCYDYHVTHAIVGKHPAKSDRRDQHRVVWGVGGMSA